MNVAAIGRQRYFFGQQIFCWRFIVLRHLHVANAEFLEETIQVVAMQHVYKVREYRAVREQLRHNCEWLSRVGTESVAQLEIEKQSVRKIVPKVAQTSK
jgi:hypothetical protein